jgi:4-amino-4-deoxy-L-arabinose transferase-like glycosyltransferase
MDRNRQQDSQPVSREVWYIVGLLLTGYFFFFWRLGSPAFYDLDEGGYAEIAREILVLNDWIIPHLNFVRLLDKPPLLYWLTAVSYKLFGISEFTARLPVALSTLGCMFLCYLLGKRLFGSLAGFLSALILATSAGTFIFGFGRQLLPDMPFTFFVAATFSALLLGYFEPTKRQRYYLLGYTAMALAVMTKGLIGLVFPALAVIGYILLTKEFKLIKQLHLVKGTVLFFILVLPWPLLVELKSEGFLKFYLLDVHILRFFHQGMIASYGASLPLPYFWAVTALWLYPWAIFLPLAFWWHFPFHRQRLSNIDKATLWLWLWAGAILIFFSLSSFRLDIYGLPALPAFALLLGRFWAEALKSPGDTRYYRGILAAMTLIVMIGGVMILVSWFPKELRQGLSRELYGMVDTDFRGYYQGITSDAKVVSLPSWEEIYPLWIVGSSILLVGNFLALLAVTLNRLAWSFALIIITMFPIAYCTQLGLTLFAPCKSSKSLADIIASTFQPGEKIIKDGRYEEIATVTFYTGQRIYLVHGKRDDLLFGSRYPEAVDTFLDEKEFFRLWNSETRVYLLTDYPVNHKPERERFYSNLSLYPLGRSGNIQLFSNRPNESTIP